MTPRCLRSLVALLLVGSTAALPLAVPERTLCANGQCDKLDMKYERIVPVQPGIQWPDAGGYCGSWASQRAFLGIGAWVSQQQVRDHTVSCGHGAHDEEILSCNIEEAWTNLKIEFNSFDYMNQTKPQTAAYQTWLKKQLVSGYAVTWAIMWDGQTYPVYGLKPPAGMYGHYEPVIGIQSNHPLSDPKVRLPCPGSCAGSYTAPVQARVHIPLTSVYRLVRTVLCTTIGSTRG